MNEWIKDSIKEMKKQCNQCSGIWCIYCSDNLLCSWTIRYICDNLTHNIRKVTRLNLKTSTITYRHKSLKSQTATDVYLKPKPDQK